jgi:hypothetical protein
MENCPPEPSKNSPYYTSFTAPHILTAMPLEKQEG